MTKSSVVQKTTHEGPIPCQDGLTPERLEAELWTTEVELDLPRPLERWKRCSTHGGTEDSPGSGLSAITDGLYDLRCIPSPLWTSVSHLYNKQIQPSEAKSPFHL